ncbi:MAG: hypothetical protein IKU46_00145 [Peptococcaceae bacterium]|nr:hypothetical protein [Peptococcaceae bacterium]
MDKKFQKAVATVCMGAAVLTLTPAVSMAETASLSVNHQQENVIVPYMLYIDDIVCGLDINETNATVDCSVWGQEGVATKTKIIVELQLKSGSSWLPVKIWTVTENGSEAEVYDSYSVKSGNTYRVKTTGTVWVGSQSETQYAYSAEKTV